MTLENKLITLQEQYSELIPRVKAVNKKLRKIGLSRNEIEQFWKEIVENEQLDHSEK